MLLDRVMLRMESLSFPGRLLPLSSKNGDNSQPIRLEEVKEEEDIPDKSKCFC